jgi:hypothetical protein
VPRTWIGLLLSLVIASGCGTDAEGTAECRAFERVRCQAAAACGYPDVDECIRYERDQCLHGVALESITAAELDVCAEEMARAGRCAAGQGPDTPAASCAEPVQADSAATSCDVVRSPERALSCAFLVPTASAAAPVPRDGGS